MKILLIAPHPFFKERGTPIAVRLLAESLCELGNNIDLLTYNEGEDVNIKCLTTYRIPDFPFLHNIVIGFSIKKIIADIFLIFKMFSLLKKNNYDVIHAVEESIFPAAIFNKIFKKKLVYDMDSSMADQLIEKWGSLSKISRFLYSFEKWAAKNSTVVIPVCKYLANKIKEYDKTVRIEILEDIAFDPDYLKNKNENLREFINNDAVLGLYIGNLEHYQGIDLLLEGLSKVKTDVSYQVALIGGNDESIKFYKEKVKRLSLDRMVLFLGPRSFDQLPFLLEQADILYSPRTKGENTPMKVYSYLASGVPVMATNIGSHTQAMSSKEVKLFDPTPESFAINFQELLENEEERKMLGDAGKLLAEESYSLRSYKKKIKNIYKWLESN